MKLSLSTSALDYHISKGMTDRGVIETVRRCGFRVVDYDMTWADFNDPINTGRELKSALTDNGVEAFQAHAIGFDFANPANRDKVGTLKNCFIFCKEAGIPAIVVHPSAVPGNTREEFFAMNFEFYKSLVPFCEETGVGLLLENIGNPMDPYFLLDGKDLREMVDGVNHPMVTACWDIGHANHFRAEEHSQYDSITALGDKLTAIHFHDNAGNFEDPYQHIRVDMHMIPYMSWVGSVNYDAVMNGLIDVGYNGTFNLELSGANSRPFIVPFEKDGKLENRLQYPSVDLWVKIYSTVYEIGKYMLSAYGLFEE